MQTIPQILAKELGKPQQAVENVIALLDQGCSNEEVTEKLSASYSGEDLKTALKEIQELTDKIYKEGVEKGNEEAGRIIADANAQKQAILTEAEAEAKRIVAQAEKQAAELKKNTEAELKLFATQSVEALKSEVVNLITGKITSSNVKAIVSDTAFMQKVILEMAKEWVVKEAITIRTADADALTKYFEANAKSLLDGGVKIEKVSGHDASFTIVPADGSYKVSFGEDEFVAFFKEFLRPGLVEMLF